MARDYTTLITSQHADKPRFVAMVGLTAGMLGQAGDVARALPTAFSLDAAIGVQLDQVGLWVGISRTQTLPIPNAYFSWDTPGLGWDQANWKGPYDPVEGITVLDDETYRAVLRAKIASNYWDGTLGDSKAIGSTALASIGITCVPLDNLDMSITLYIEGSPSAVLLEMIRRGFFPGKAAGVRIAGYVLVTPAMCTLEGRSAYVGRAVVGCTVVGFAPPLVPDTPTDSSIPGTAVPGYATPGAY